MPERAIENTASAPSSATSSAPSGATATAHGSLSGAPAASSEAAPPLGMSSTRPELPNQLPSSAIAMSPGAPCAAAGAAAEAHERDERRRETPHAGTASEPISAANADTTRGSKCSPAQRSISATASRTVSPGW